MWLVFDFLLKKLKIFDVLSTLSQLMRKFATQIFALFGHPIRIGSKDVCSVIIAQTIV